MNKQKQIDSLKGDVYRLMDKIRLLECYFGIEVVNRTRKSDGPWGDIKLEEYEKINKNK